MRILLLLLLFLPAMYSQILDPILYGNTIIGSLSGSMSGNSTSSTVVNLTSEGSTDWYSMGGDSTTNTCPGVNRKTTGGSVIGGYTFVGGASGLTGASFYLLQYKTWTDGTPTGSDTAGAQGDGCSFVGSTLGYGFSFTCPASTVSHVCTLHIDSLNGTIFTINGHLSDSSAVDYNDSETVGASGKWYTYTFTYNTASAGQTLTLTVAQGSGSSGDPFFEAITYQ